MKHSNSLVTSMIGLRSYLRKVRLVISPESMACISKFLSGRYRKLDIEEIILKLVNKIATWVQISKLTIQI